MKTQLIPHPSRSIPVALTDAIHGLSADAERSGSLHPRQLALIYEQRWFSLFVPRSYGGLEMSLPEGLRIEEGLAWADGSTGWTVTLCSGANWFIGFLRPELAKQLFGDQRVCFAGSGRASGVAKIVAGGYEISGRWRYATGAPHATAFTANCRIEKNGTFLQDDKGNPLVYAFLFTRAEIIIHEDWHSIGMVATASHSFEVKDQQVTGDRCFRIDPDGPFLPQPIYRYPFLQFAEATLAVNSSGMAARFIDLCGRIGPERTKDANNRLQGWREVFYEAVEASWQECAKGDPLPPGLLQAVSTASRRLAAEARRMVDELYPWCGIAAANPDTQINRVWRDLHTASQHSLLTLGA